MTNAGDDGNDNNNSCEITSHHSGNISKVPVVMNGIYSFWRSTPL